MIKKLLVIGHKGQVGSELIKLGAEIYSEELALQHKDTHEIVIINAAAITDDRRCRENQFLAWLSNAHLVAQLAQIVRHCRGRLIHISTDYVFDGQRGAYDEFDQINPPRDNVYAISKAAGEFAFESVAPIGSNIVRTQWVFGLKRKAWFGSETIWDQKGGLTYAPDLAKFLIKLAETKTPTPRLIHYATKPYVTRESAVILYGNLNPKVVPVPLGKPKDTSLRTSDFCSEIHTPMKIEEAMDEYKRANPFENTSAF